MTTQQAANEHEARELDRKLYLVSNMADTLRDTARGLLELGASGMPASGALAQRFNRLRTRALESVAPAHAAQIAEWTPELTNGVTSLDVVFDAAATLAGLLDTALGEETFLAQRTASRHEIGQLLTKVGLEPSRPQADDRGGHYM